MFDLDGTLVDTAQDLVGTLNALLGEHDLPPVDLRDAQNLIGRGATSLIERGFGEHLQRYSTEQRHALLQRFVAYYEAHLLDNTVPYAGVATILEKLRELGYEMAVCTSKGTGPAKAIMEGLGIAHFFSAVCGGDYFPGVKKPDKAHVFGTVEAAGRNLEQRAIFIGDSGVDVKAAKNAGIPLIYATYGYNDVAAESIDADGVIAAFGELPDAIATLEAHI
ncbi:HAD hydrolase-like protein [Paraburkholderia bryophila]|uniref:HAD hydrolase-like protein n=1 Tax=Burkholderiaceae TaxID=119060 RepID=UPI0018CDAF0A|nr:HAD hydrolase-like protein [Burkholderia sp. 9120]